MIDAQGLSFLIHGGPKVGKSSLAATVPAPRLILDAESGSFWTPGRKKRWNPMRETVPTPGRHLTAGYGQPSVTPDWESAMVTVHDAQVASYVYQVLASGQHPFNGLSMDSLTEIQQRIMDSLAGTGKMSRDDWGALLRKVNGLIRNYRDLLTHPVKPLWGICFICGTKPDAQTGRWEPLLQGGSGDYAPYYVDVLGFLTALQDNTRHLFIGPHPQFLTGERVQGRLPHSLQIGGAGYPGWTISTMVQHVLTGDNAA